MGTEVRHSFEGIHKEVTGLRNELVRNDMIVKDLGQAMDEESMQMLTSAGFKT